MTTGTMTKNCTWDVGFESYPRHLTNLIRSQLGTWKSSLSGVVSAHEGWAEESQWLNGASAFFVYQRMDQIGYYDLGNQLRRGDVELSVELWSGNKKDYLALVRLFENYIMGLDSTPVDIKTGRTEERRQRLILNRSNDLSEHTSLIFRKNYDITLTTKYKIA